MFDCRKHRLLALCAILVAIAGGCGPTVARNGTNVMVKWDRLGSMAIEVQKPEGAVWYFLEGNAVFQVVDALRENTVAESSPSRTIQTFGRTEIRILAFDQVGGQLHRFLVDFQYVEGMGDKRHPNPRAGLFEGQRERCLSALILIEETGRPISMVDFEKYVQHFSDINYVFLYWKN